MTMTLLLDGWFGWLADWLVECAYSFVHSSALVHGKHDSS